MIIRMMVIWKKEKGDVVITNIERCSMICAKMPIGINHFPAEATCMDVLVWKTGQPFRWFKNCVISKAFRCWYTNAGGIPGKLLFVVSVVLPLVCRISQAVQGGKPLHSTANPALPSV